LFGLVVAQACLGIATLVLFNGDGSIHLQLTHQFGAIIVLSAAILHLRSLTPPAAAPRRA
jgi:heme A synthase